MIGARSRTLNFEQNTVFAKWSLEDQTEIYTKQPQPQPHRDSREMHLPRQNSRVDNQMCFWVERPCHNCWLIDSAADVHICNNRSLMTKYYKKPTRIRWSKADGSPPGKGSIRLRLGLENGSERMISNLQNVYYLSSSPCNLVSLGLLNDSGISNDNGNKTLYQLGSNRVLAKARRWRNSYLFQPLNLSDAAVFLTKIDDETYEWPPHTFLNSSSPKTLLPLTIWHKRLRNTNRPSLKAYLKKLGVSYIDDSEGHVCDSCQRAKVTKIYNREQKKRSQ